MTRAYFVIEKNGKVVDAFYAYCDGYPDGEDAMTMVQAFRDGRFAEEIQEHNNEIDGEPLTGLEPYWYQGKDVFEDYVYVLRGNTLHIYHFGKYLIKLSKEDAGVWLHAMEMKDILYFYFSYDKELLDTTMYSGEFYRLLSNRIKDGTINDEWLSNIKETYRRPTMFLNDGHVMDAWCHLPERPSWYKILEIRDKRIDFIVYKDWKKWDVYIQLPFTREPIRRDLPSEKRAVDAIRCLIHKVGEEKLYAFASMCDEVKKMRNDIFELKKNKVPNRNKICESIKFVEESWKKQEWWTASDSFTVDRITDRFDKLAN